MPTYFKIKDDQTVRVRLLRLPEKRSRVIVVSNKEITVEYFDILVLDLQDHQEKIMYCPKSLLKKIINSSSIYLQNDHIYPMRSEVEINKESRTNIGHIKYPVYHVKMLNEYMWDNVLKSPSLHVIVPNMSIVYISQFSLE